MNARPLRVGVWCSYHITLVPSEGIGVFAHHLARGLADLDDGTQVDLHIRPGDEALVEELRKRADDALVTLAIQKEELLKGADPADDLLTMESIFPAVTPKNRFGGPNAMNGSAPCQSG